MPQLEKHIGYSVIRGKNTSIRARLAGYRWRSRQAGLALILILLLNAVTVTLGLFMLTTANIDLQIAHNDQLTKQALAIAEAGVNHAHRLLDGDANGFNDELDGTGTSPQKAGTGGVLASLGSPKTANGKDYRFVAFGGNGDPDGYYLRIEDNYDENPNVATADGDGDVTLISRGYLNGAERIIEVRIQNKGYGGIYSRTKITFSGGSSSDSYNSAAGAYDPSNPGTNGDLWSNGDITLSSSSTTIKGDVTTGGTLSNSGAVITGTITSGASPLTFASVTPCGPPYSDGTGITGGSYDSSTGELSQSGGGNITLANGTYCFSEITLSGSSTLTVNGPVVIYLTDDSTLSGGGVFNTTQLPKNLKIFSSGSKVTVSGGSGAYMSVYAPDAKIDVSGASHFYGGMVGDEIVASGGTSFHVDGDLGGVQMTSWNDVR